VGDTTSAPLEIAFLRFSNDPTSPDLFRMAADGRGSTRVAALPGEENLPAWSADGKRFAFVGVDGPPGYGPLKVMNVDGTAQREIVVAAFGGVCCASWSPDGTQLAFYGLDSMFTFGIGVIDVDGTNLRWLPGTADAVPNAATWSPDGRRIAFGASDRTTFLSSIRIVDADGSNPRVLTSGLLRLQPSWSPDGSQIAFAAMNDRQDALRIAVIDTNGTGERYVSTSGSDAMPAWSPDGRFIVYEHGIGSSRHIYKMSVSGGSPEDLTPNALSARSPMWRRVAT
jgi:TolB protein